MGEISKSFKDENGNEETIIITSQDNHQIDLSKSYKLANHNTKRENKLVKKFKGSILGAEIGTKSAGFSTIVVLAIVIALAVIAAMYFSWRF